MPVTTGGYDTATPADITGSIDQAVAKFLAESRYTLQERPGVVKSSIRVETLPENEGPYLNTPKYATVNAIALTQGVDMSTASEITDTMMSIQPTEFGAQVILTDMMMMTVRDEFFRVAGRILADGYDRFQDQTLCDDFANFGTTIVGAGGFLNFGYLMAGHARIKLLRRRTVAASLALIRSRRSLPPRCPTLSKRLSWVPLVLPRILSQCRPSSGHPMVRFTMLAVSR